jgi:hypothetical protein
MTRLRLGIALLVAGAGLSLGSPAAADCAAPFVHVSPRRVAPGEELTIEGDSWGDACNDTPGLGCDPPPLGEPIEDIRLRLRSVDGAQTVDLGAIDADDGYSLATTVEVGDLPPGVYLVTASAGGHRATARLRIVGS